MDSLSYLFILLSAIIPPIAILATKDSPIAMPGFSYALILFLQSALIGFFLSRDLFVFTVFFEAMLLPLFFLIAILGGGERRNASLLFLIYMAAGSFLLLLGLVSIFILHGSFDIEKLSSLETPFWVGLVFFLAFAVKTPLFPFHAWLPKAYVEADTAGTILLSAVLSKAGIYGFMRLGIELFPSVLAQLSPFLMALAVTGVFYGGFLAWSENNFKRLIAFSSFSHVNFILAGFFSLNESAAFGSILQAFSHGITIAALFLVSGFLERKVKTRQISEVRGASFEMPKLAYLTLFFALSSIALPLTNMFVGEFLILYGVFGKNPWTAGVLTLSLILGAIYMLRFIQKVYFEPPSENLPKKSDMQRKDLLIALPLIVLVLWVGIYPAPFLEKIESVTLNQSQNVPQPNSSQE